MMRNWLIALSMAAAIALPGASALAADHRDGPEVLKDPATDINDLYTWMSSDGTKVYLIMTVFQQATTDSKFSDQAIYTFHTASRASFMSTQLTNVDISCTFDSTQRIICWVPQAGGAPLLVSGDASTTTGISDSASRVKVFAGLRKDHFFFNLDGFKNMRTTVTNAITAGTITLDSDKCPTGPASTLNTYAGLLSRNSAGMNPATDYFLNLNTLAIVMEVDKSLLTTGGPILSVWAATRKK